MWGSYCPDVVDRRAPFRTAHLDNLRQLHAEGKLLAIGPTTDLKKVFAVYAVASLEEAKQLVEADPYWQNGIWTEYEIYEWNQVF